MNNEHYIPNADNITKNAINQGIDLSKDIEAQKLTTYPCIDNLQNTTIKDDFIYLTTTERQHNLISRGEALSTIPDDHQAFSGYFTNDATVQNRLSGDGTFDSYGLHRDLCVCPNIYTKEMPTAEPMDKQYLERFYIDRDRLEQIYGTRDFNAAIGKCSANNQYGSDGGDQGYNACLTELYNNGCLKYAGTYEATPGSTTKCQEEYKTMSSDAKKKCEAELSNQSSEDIQKIGYPLDKRCHDKTAFHSEAISNLEVKYKDYQPTYNQALADSTKPEDRIYMHSLAESPHNSNTPHNPPPPPSAKSKELSEISRNADEISQKLADNTNSAEKAQSTVNTMTGGMA